MTDVTDDSADHGLSAYAGGGGGTVLEHRFAATALAALLTGSPFALLGDGVTVDKVAFQARHRSPVDDLIVTGTVGTAAPELCEIAVAVRRDPTIGKSDAKFRKLLGQMIAFVDEHWVDLRSGRWRLGLVVAGPHTGAKETRRLVELARNQPDAEAFRAAVLAPGATTGKVRLRLRTLEDAVEAVAPGGPIPTTTWRLLASIVVAEVRLEGEPTPDRAAVISQLQPFVADANEADDLFTRLTGLADRYVPLGAEVDAGILRRDLRGHVRIAGSYRYRAAWALLDRLDERARVSVGHDLVDGDRRIAIDRTAIRNDLVAAVEGLSDEVPAVVVTGDPDVGKSAVAIDATAALAGVGWACTVVDLRGLPVRTAELEHELGDSISAVLAAAPVGVGRVLLVEGAEAVNEGWDTIFSDLVGAAVVAGHWVVVVARRDVTASIERVLADHLPATAFVEVPAFSVEEIRQVALAFPQLARFVDDARSSWLVARPGLVEIILRSGATLRLPDRPLSEADVFAAVWASLVRNDERNPPGGPSPDGREQALVALGARALDRTTAPPISDLSVLPSLRSDGLLRSVGATTPFSSGDAFARDLVRDFAIARYLITDGLVPLSAAGAPRWATRALRLALQTQLAVGEVRQRRRDLLAAVESIASLEGSRWVELVDEALLTLGNADEAITEVWPDLVADGFAGLERLLQIVDQRYTHAGVAEWAITGPFVAACLDRAVDLVGLSMESARLVTRTRLGYLRGLVLGRVGGGDPLRIRLRDLAVAAAAERLDEEAVETLALLGPDLDGPAEEILRQIAAHRSHDLDVTVERQVARLSLATHHPDLLLVLADAYYLDRRPQQWAGFGGPLHDGIRHHRHVGIGFPFSDRFFGPFALLLQVRPIEAIALVNRMCDHAGAIRARDVAADGSPSGPVLVPIELPGGEVRELVGGPDGWSWYRGTNVPPYPCTSALLAVEAAADAWLAAGVPTRVIVTRLLEGCHNLPMVALVVGFLERHLEQCADELDGFLAQPIVWDLEASRMVGEHGPLRAQRDDKTVVGYERRKWNFPDLALTMTVNARLAGDVERMEALGRVADLMIERSRDAAGNVGPVALRRASALRAENLEATARDDGIVISPRVPAEAQDDTEKNAAEHAIGEEVFRLLNVYARHPERWGGDAQALATDVGIARALYERIPPSVSYFAAEAFPAVASAALCAHAEGAVVLDDEELEWAAAEVIFAVLDAPVPGETDVSVSPSGRTRSAAVALPLLLLPAFFESAGEHTFDLEDHPLIEQAIAASARHVADEVRRLTATSLAQVWGAPCAAVIGGRCRHEIAFAALEAALRDCRFAPSENGWRAREEIEGDLIPALEAIEAGDLILGRLSAPIVGLTAASLSGSCVAERAIRLLDPVLAAHRRSAVDTAAHQFSMPDDDQLAVVQALVDLAAGGRPDELDRHLEAMVADPAALWQFLRLCSQLATYDTGRRAAVGALWPRVMDVLLDGIAAGNDPRRTGSRRSSYRRDDAIASIMSRPEVRVAEPQFDDILLAARAAWFPLAGLRPQIERWLNVARGSSASLDALVEYLRTLPVAEQVSPGLEWVEAVVDGRHREVGGRSFLVAGWVTDLREAASFGNQDRRRFLGLVDGFTASGDQRFVEIQRREEGELQR